MIKNILLVGMGGAAGSIARYFLSYIVSKNFISDFPSGTFLVNILGSLIIGIIYGLAEEQILSPSYRLLLATGFCGGFTTFSAFTSENLSLLQKNEYGLFFSYTFFSIALGIVAVFAGIWLAKNLNIVN